MHSIRTALSNFEDMRINAKELAILKDAKRTTLNAEKDQVRLDLIPSVSGWVWLVDGWSLPLLRPCLLLWVVSDLFVCWFCVSLFVVCVFGWSPGDATDLFVSWGRANRGGGVRRWYIGARWFLECGGFGRVYGKANVHRYLSRV